MRIECVKEKLIKALSKAEKITAKNATLPVLSCFLLVAEKDHVTIRATNLDLGIEITLPVKVMEAGTVAVPAQTFSSFISSIFNDKNIVIESEGTILKISTDHTSTTIKTLSAEDFPVLPRITGHNTCILPAKDFLKGLRSVYYAASTSTIKPALSSIYIYPDGDMLVFVATDSFRLAEKKIRVKKEIDFKYILLPLKNSAEIMRIFEDIDDEIVCTIDENQISFEYQGLYLTSRVIDAIFPDYKQIIPKEHATEGTVLKYDLVNALKMSNIFADKFNQVYITLSEKPKKFEIKTKNADIGENTSTIDAVVKGDTVSMSFNYKYITDSFTSIDTDSLSLYFTDASHAMVLRGVNDKSFLYLVMPMNK